MKNIFLALSLLFSISFFAQEGLKFENSSFTELLAKAKKEKKLIFVDAMASWCGPCKMMDRDIFPLKSVGDFYNANFINAKLDMEKGEGLEFARKYAVRSYPSYFFIDGDGQVITKNMGYQSESNFLQIGQEAQANIGIGETLKAKFEKGEKNLEFLAKMIQTYANTDYELAKRASERYFKNKINKEYTKDEVGFLLYFIKDEKDVNYKNFVSDKSEILKIVPEKDYTDFGNQILMSKITSEAIDEKSKLIKDDQFLAQATPIIGREAALETLNQLKLNYYELSDNFPLYEKAALKQYENPDGFPPTEVLKAAWIFSEKATDPQSIKMATMWTEKILMQSETSESTYILANLYLKAGKKQEAKIYAKHSIQLAKSSQKDSSLAEKLLQSIQ
ncbi:thioredoxin family protein [Frigoriflavimonas asaccharolytica]|uniref:Thioredoxin-related protein n=1 Tax=Frigoriflavimonas asaccharolytica TaxID=2735899 RepID=A0A8J8G8Z0_9FLAO|nr:thioredoxin family protein [Frigoriflavimonas asaccharolytica]NRS93111.1 thioredoxin-related protein [Frigoriflavimonas asaccharolytica]